MQIGPGKCLPNDPMVEVIGKKVLGKEITWFEIYSFYEVGLGPYSWHKSVLLWRVGVVVMVVLVLQVCYIQNLRNVLDHFWVLSSLLSLWKSIKRRGSGSSINIKLPYDPATLLLLQRIQNRYSSKNWYVNIHSNTIHNSYKVEITQMAINTSMDKQKWD